PKTPDHAAEENRFRVTLRFRRRVGELRVHRFDHLRNRGGAVRAHPEIVDSARTSLDFFEVIATKHQKTGCGSLGDSTDNSERDVKRVVAAPAQLNLLSFVQVETLHGALRTQSRRAELVELLY